MSEELSGTLGVVKDIFCLQGNGIGLDLYNQAVTGCVSKSITSSATDSDHIPAVLLESNPTDARLKISKDGIVQKLKARMGTGGNNVPMVMEEKTDPVLTISSTNSNATYGNDIASPIINRSGTGGGNSPMVLQGNYVVRRLTPKECERLQGFPDDWTDIGEWVDSKGKKHKSNDSARFKAIGNSIAVPFWFWLLRRISAQYPRIATMGSLFDGIGGFPYCWEMCNGKGSAVWASEIEEFPIAVTKVRFPDEESEAAEHEKEN